MDHVCRTSDGKEIKLGMKVRDYDWKIGTVVEAPEAWELERDEVCWSRAGHNGHWWGVCTDRPGHVHAEYCRGKLFDGSRLTTRLED